MSRLFAAAAAFAVLVAAPAVAQDMRFEIVNNSSLTLYSFYASPTHGNHWSHDILGSQVPPGTSGSVLIADGETTCVYDMRFVMHTGQEITGQTDICRSARYVLQ